MSRSTVLLESHADGGTAGYQHSYAFSGLCAEIFATSPAQVAPAIEQLEEGVANGLHAAGYIGYEAASGLDPVLATQSGSDPMPLLWFGMYESKVRVNPGALLRGTGYSVTAWRPSCDRARYERALARIRDYIGAGDTYQVNYTLRLLADFAGDEVAFYRDLCRVQPTPYCAFLDLGRYAILSVSPELFFSLKEGVLTSRPMKGTCQRGRWPEEDRAVANELRGSAKERAENLMILDLMRSDIGRVSVTGSVKVPELWRVARYPSLWQMTSEVTSRVRPGTGLLELFTALFPCGSVTGTPKVRTMQIIAELEDRTRGVYTGCVGYVSPGMEACFSVAIRTVVFDREKGVVEYGVGGGVTWDSISLREYREWQLKARILSVPEPEFSLQEILLLEQVSGAFLLDRHLERLQASADYFDFSLDSEALRRDLDTFCRERGSEAPAQVLVSLVRTGAYHFSLGPLPPVSRWPQPAVVSEVPVDRWNRFLFHQTTLPKHHHGNGDPAGFELQINGEGEVTECRGGNLVAVIAGKAWTPPVECGLLPGVLRAELLSCGKLAERVLHRRDLEHADELYSIDSVRQWVPLSLSR